MNIIKIMDVIASVIFLFLNISFLFLKGIMLAITSIAKITHELEYPLINLCKMFMAQTSIAHPNIIRDGIAIKLSSVYRFGHKCLLVRKMRKKHIDINKKIKAVFQTIVTVPPDKFSQHSKLRHFSMFSIFFYNSVLLYLSFSIVLGLWNIADHPYEEKLS